MTVMEAITAISQEISREFNPEQIILFGSYAYGKPRSDSDVDLLVVMQHEGQNVYQAIEILNRVPPPFAVDLLVRTPTEVTQRLALNDFFLRDIVAKGRILYAAAHGVRGDVSISRGFCGSCNGSQCICALSQRAPRRAGFFQTS